MAQASKRQRIFIQVWDFSKHRFYNYTSFKTYEEAVESMHELSEKYPEARFQILDKNLETHTKNSKRKS